MNNNQKIYLDEEGFEEYLKELKNLEKKLEQIKKEKVNAGKGKTHDGFHDNFEYEQARREQDVVSAMINQKKGNLSNIVVIKREGKDEMVDIGDFVYLDVFMDGKDPQGKLIKLTGSTKPKVSGEIHEVTINSPVGKAIYKKKVGSDVTYSVKGNPIKVIIRSKSSNLGDLLKDKNCIKR